MPNVFTILSLFITVFLGLLADVEYWFVVIGLTLHSISLSLNIFLVNSYQLLSKFVYYLTNINSYKVVYFKPYL